MSAAARLDALTRAAALLCEADDGDVQQIGEAMVDWINGGAARLDDALGLRAGPGQRSALTVASSNERDRLLREAAQRFFPGQPASTQAERLADKVALYRGGADWRRDRTVAEITYRDTLRGHCWAILRAVDHPLSARRIRAILATSS